MLKTRFQHFPDFIITFWYLKEVEVVFHHVAEENDTVVAE